MIMTTQEVVTTADLAKQILACSQEEFTGQLDLVVKEPKAQCWRLYFRQGALIWGVSEVHRTRRLLRQLSQYCPQLLVNSTALASLQMSAVGRGVVQLPYEDYQSLAELVRQGKLRRSQMAAIAEVYITEMLFDVHQQWDRFRYRSQLRLIYRPIAQNLIDAIDSTSISIPVDRAWQQSLQAWQAWQQQALAEISPNLAPAIAKPEELRWQTPPKIYHNLIARIDGQQTFRDLAVKLGQNLLPLTQSIMPYIRKGLIELLEVEDLSHSIKPATTTPPQRALVSSRLRQIQPQPTSPLVVYIDDSPREGQIMNQILTQAGYRCILIEDSVKALLLLLEHKPDLIFLDLVMPITNGYELCAQIRRISAFKDTPVIILTSNDGIIDRLRAKMVGSSGFLAKPIEPEKVVTTLQRYLPTTMPLPFNRDMHIIC
jgi:two-component system, chemotaxis family, response regulator PixG